MGGRIPSGGETFFFFDNIKLFVNDYQPREIFIIAPLLSSMRPQSVRQVSTGNVVADDARSNNEEEIKSMADDRASLFSEHTQGGGASGADSDRPLLFNELPYSSIPGNLHLSSDDVVERFINRYGKINVVRQLARDLAEREAEVSLLRRQHVDRERELRKMLVEADVARSDIDKRLMNMTATSVRKPNIMINELVGEAIESRVGELEEEEEEEEQQEGDMEPNGDTTAGTITVSAPDNDKINNNTTSDHTRSRSQSTTRSLMGYILGENKKEDISKDSNEGQESSSSPQPVQTNNNRPASVTHVASSAASTSSFQDHGPMELNDIVPQSIQPPTLLQSWYDHYGAQHEYLTDRFGFIYDRKNPNFYTKQKSDINKDPEDEQNESSNGSIGFQNNGSEQPAPKTSTTVVPEHDGIQLSSSQPITQTQTNHLPSSGGLEKPSNIATEPTADSSASSVRMLLAQLTDMHDGIQKAQTTKWDEFLRRVNSNQQKPSDPAVISRGQLLGVSGTELLSSGRKGGNGKGLWKDFKELVSQGVPVAYRPKIWGECSGAWTLKEPGTYEALINQTGESEALGQIELDLYRTMPYNVFFGGNGPGVDKLRRVLVAYSRWNPEVGYCQGMNVIAAILLLTYATEEDAFWSLVSLVENILPEGWFTPQLLTSRAFQRVFNQYFVQHLPKLNEHFTNLSVQIDAITFDWFLSCFTDALPAEVLFRVWDVFLCVEGLVHLFRLALALFKINESQLLKLQTGAEIYSHMKNLVNQPIRITELVSQTNVYYNQITDKDLRDYREKEVEKLKAEISNTTTTW